jgi:hypothetical protein
MFFNSQLFSFTDLSGFSITLRLPPKDHSVANTPVIRYTLPVHLQRFISRHRNLRKLFLKASAPYASSYINIQSFLQTSCFEKLEVLRVSQTFTWKDPAEGILNFIRQHPLLRDVSVHTENLDFREYPEESLPLPQLRRMGQSTCLLSLLDLDQRLRLRHLFLDSPVFSVVQVQHGHHMRSLPYIESCSNLTRLVFTVNDFRGFPATDTFHTISKLRKLEDLEFRFMWNGTVNLVRDLLSFLAVYQCLMSNSKASTFPSFFSFPTSQTHPRKNLRQTPRFKTMELYP